MLASHTKHLANRLERGTEKEDRVPKGTNFEYTKEILGITVPNFLFKSAGENATLGKEIHQRIILPCTSLALSRDLCGLNFG